MGQSQFPLVVALPAFTYTQFSISAVCLKRLKVLKGRVRVGGEVQQHTLNSLERANEGPTKKRRKLVARPQDTLHTPLMSSERGSSGYSTEEGKGSAEARWLEGGGGREAKPN